MKTLLPIVIFLFTACAQPKIPTLPPTELDPKYFKRDKLYPYIYLKDGYLEEYPSTPYDKKLENFPALPQVGAKYWQNIESFTNEIDLLTIRIPVKLKNSGKILAYTNSAGGIFLNEDEVLVSPEEITQLIKLYPRFFKYCLYEDRLYAYTNFAASFFREVSNIQQLENHISNIVKFQKEYMAFIRQIADDSSYSNKYSPSPYVEAVFTFTNFYVSPEKSLRICQVMGLYASLGEYLKYTVNLKEGQISIIWEEVGVRFLPQDNLQNFYNAVLNLLWLQVYNSREHQSDKLDFGNFERSELRDLNAMGLNVGDGQMFHMVKDTKT